MNGTFYLVPRRLFASRCTVVAKETAFSCPILDNLPRNAFVDASYTSRIKSMLGEEYSNETRFANSIASTFVH